MKKSPGRASSYDDLRREIVGHFPSLSKCLQQIATYALDNPNEMALDTIASVAPRAGVQPSSLVRFAKVFGFSGYSEMQRVFRGRLTDAMPSYTDRLRMLGGDGQPPGRQSDDTTSLLEQFVRADIAGLQSVLQQERLAQLLESAIELITRAGTVYLVAHRRSFPVACYLSYALSQLHVRNVLVDGVGGLFFQQMSHATPGDLVLAVSTKAYSPDVVQAVREAAQRKIPIVAITDSALSPLAEHAAVSIELHEASVQMFRSLAVPMTLAVTLVVALGRVLEAKGSAAPSARKRRARDGARAPGAARPRTASE